MSNDLRGKSMELDNSIVDISTSIKSEEKDVKSVNMASYEAVTLVPVLVGRLPEDLRLLGKSEQEKTNGFRKIEPKPCVESVVEDAPTDVGESNIKRKRKKDTVRFLRSNATRRGVRLCITCKGKIGYRSKKCKHCLKIHTVPKKTLPKKSSKVSMLPTCSSTEEKLQEKQNIVQIKYENKILLHEKENIAQAKLENIIPAEQPNHEEVDLICIHEDLAFSGEKPMNSEPIEGEIEQPNDKDDITQELDQNLSSGQGMCSSSPHDHLIEKQCVTPEHQKTDDSFISSVELNNVESFTPTGSKRKQKTCSGGRKKQSVVCSVFQFVRIEPKPCQDETHSRVYFKPIVQRHFVKNSGKTDSKRFLSSNATRRGIMSCPLCQKEVGCRSKSCKHCKVAIHYMENKALEQKNLLIVQLSPLTDPECVVFSVKKMTTPSEERCFLKRITKEAKYCKDVEMKDEFNWSCECIQGDGTTNGFCEHAMFFFRSPKIVQARTATLTAQAIDCLPIDNSFKDKLKTLWEKNQTKELPIVQQVALNTLVVLETEESASFDNECGTSCTSCVHIRFEKVKRQSSVQPHIFCSGKSCSFWTPFENQKDSPVTCLHYCISLWAIASDSQLEGYFKIFLEAPQVYLHSDVFDGVLSPC